MLPGRFFSPHQSNLPTHTWVIKGSEYQACPVRNSSIGGHFRKERRPDSVRYHLYNCRKAGRLVRNRHILFAQLTRLECVIPEAMPLFQKQHLSILEILGPELLTQGQPRIR